MRAVPSSSSLLPLPSPSSIILLLFLLAAAPTASADHVYSHRYVAFLRVVDASDQPVPGVRVQLAVNTAVEGACGTQPKNATEYFGDTVTRPVSDRNGFVIFCDHVHAMDLQQPPTAVISAEGATLNYTMDAQTRVDYETLVVPNATGSAPPTSGMVVAGRAWRETVAETLVEGIPVYGDTIKNASVTVGAIATRTNNYGDFSVLADANATSVEILNASYPLAIEHGWAHVKAKLPALPPDATITARSDGTVCWWETPDAPGAKNPDITFPANRSASVLVDPAGHDAILAVGSGQLGFRAGDPALELTLASPPNGTTSYGCEPSGATPAGHLRWVDAGTTPSTRATTTTSTPAATATPAASATKPAPAPAWLALLAAGAAAAALRRRG